MKSYFDYLPNTIINVIFKKLSVFDIINFLNVYPEHYDVINECEMIMYYKFLHQCINVLTVKYVLKNNILQPNDIKTFLNYILNNYKINGINKFLYNYEKNINSYLYKMFSNFVYTCVILDNNIILNEILNNINNKDNMIPLLNSKINILYVSQNALQILEHHNITLYIEDEYYRISNKLYKLKYILRKGILNKYGLSDMFLSVISNKNMECAKEIINYYIKYPDQFINVNIRYSNVNIEILQYLLDNNIKLSESLENSLEHIINDKCNDYDCEYIINDYVQFVINNRSKLKITNSFRKLLNEYLQYLEF